MPKHFLVGLLTTSLGCAIPSIAVAVEGGLGRSITGLQVTDYAGVVPAEAGLGLSIGYVHYAGSFSAGRELPLSGRAVLGMDATFDLYSASAIYIWPVQQGQWNFASLLSVPFANVDISANFAAGAVQGAINDGFRGDLYDMSLVPVMAGYHFDDARHLSLAVYISAPTGDFDPDRFANPSLNVWVYSPTVSYTQLSKEGSIDWSTSVGVDLSTRNDDTDYRSGAVFHLDTQLVKHWGNGWAAGGTGGWIQQMSDDTGPLADRLDGFRGSSLAAGLVLGYQRKIDNGSVVFSARWLHEFNVKRRLSGDPLMISGSITF